MINHIYFHTFPPLPTWQWFISSFCTIWPCLSNLQISSLEYVDIKRSFPGNRLFYQAIWYQHWFLIINDFIKLLRKSSKICKIEKMYLARRLNLSYTLFFQIWNFFLAEKIWYNSFFYPTWPIFEFNGSYSMWNICVRFSVRDCLIRPFSDGLAHNSSRRYDTWYVKCDVNKTQWTKWIIIFLERKVLC